MGAQPKKKILFLITKSNWGGAQRYVYDLATNLPPQYEVVVAHGGNGKMAEELLVAGIRTIPLHSLQRDLSLKKELLSFREIAQLIKTERPDVLHVNSSKAGGIGAFLGRINRVPRVIYTAHGWAFNEDRSRISKIIVGWFHWLTILLSHHTITVSEAVRSQMVWPGTKQKMITVPLGRDVTTLLSQTEARSTLSQHIPVLTEHQHNLWLGSIGELHPIKRHRIAIKAMAEVVRHHPTVRYIIIGDGELRSALQQQIDRLQLSNHVFLVGHIHEASRLLSAFDIFLMPSKSEAAAYAILEAGQAGLPVVASNVGGIPEWIADQATGLLVSPDDSMALTDAITTLVTNKSLLTNYGSALLQHCQEFTTARMVASTTALYSTPQ